MTTFRGVRGGSWYLAPGDLRSAYRHVGGPDLRLIYRGFRVVARDGGCRIVRGGSWGNFPRFLRSADRSEVGPNNRSYNLGFRVVVRP